MAKLIKCPRCSAHIDVTSMQGNSTVKCPECGSSMRVPTGETAVVAVTATKPAGSARMTPLFRRMSGVRQPGSTGRPPARSGLGPDPNVRGAAGRRGANPVLWIGVAVGLAALIGILAVVIVNKNQNAARERAAQEARQKAAEEQRLAETQRQREREAAEEAAARSSLGSRPEPKLQKRDGRYDVPKEWERGSEAWRDKKVELVETPPEVDKEILAMLRSGSTQEILKNPYRCLPTVINRLLDEEESVARAALNALYEYCEAGKLYTTANKNPIQLDWACSAQYRGSEFNFWAGDWWPRNMYRFKDGPAPPPSKVDANAFDWDRLANRLRGAGAFDDPSTPQGLAFQQIKQVGRAAYPKLAAYLDNEDLGLARSVAAALNELTGEKKDLPREDTKQAIKAAWLDWISKH